MGRFGGASHCWVSRQTLSSNSSFQVSDEIKNENFRDVCAVGDSLHPLFSLFSGTSDEVPVFGSMDYWFRLKLPMTESIRAKAEDPVHPALSQDTQVPGHTAALPSYRS